MIIFFPPYSQAFIGEWVTDISIWKIYRKEEGEGNAD